MNEPEPRLQEATRWLQFAEADLAFARQLKSGDPPASPHVRRKTIALEFWQRGLSGAQCRSEERTAVTNHGRRDKEIDPLTDCPGKARPERVRKRIPATRRPAERLAAEKLGRLGALKWL